MLRTHRTVISLAALLAVVAVAACGPEEGTPDSPLEDVRDTIGEDTMLSADEVRGPLVAPGADTLALPEGVGDEGDGGGVSADDLPGWTTGRVTHAATGSAGVSVIGDLRHARNDGFDRVVVELGGDAIPGYGVQYVDRPLRECGSGNQIHPVGDGWLQLRLEPAAGHTEAGSATIPTDVQTPALRRGLRIYRTCDFEAVVTLVLAVDSPEPFRAFHLAEPARIVVDVRH